MDPERRRLDLSMKRQKINFLLLGMSLILVGCAVLPKVYVSPDFKEQDLKRIGILGFEGPATYGEYVTDIFTAELLKRLGGDYEIVGKNLLTTALRVEGIERGDIKRLGKALSLDAIVVGSIGEYGYHREGKSGVSLGWAWDDVDKKGVIIAQEGSSELPAVALSVQLLDVESGKILFSTSYAKRMGYGYSVGKLVEEMVERIAKSFKEVIEENR